ncbi:MAG: FtsX-like permease family protein [Gemmatimonadota bacterium]
MARSRPTGVAFVLRPRWRKVLRDAALHPQRTILVILAIAVGLIGAGSVLNTYSLLERTVAEGYAATNPPSAVLRTEAVDDALLAQVRGMPSVSDVQARRRIDGRVRVGGEWRHLRVFAARDYSNNRIGRVEPKAGAWPPPNGELVLEQSSLRLVEAEPGDSLRVTVADGPVGTLPVGGVAHDVGLAPGWMEHVVYVFATARTLEELGVEPGFDRLRIVVAEDALDEEHVRRVAFDVKALVESTGRTVRDVHVPTPGRHVHAGQMNSLLYIQGAFGLLTLVLSGVLVVNLMSAVLAEQGREIGVMKAVGASTGQVAGIYLTLALVMGLAASAVAIPVAGWIGGAYAAFAAELLNFEIARRGASPGVVGLQLAIGVLLPVAAAFMPVHRAARVTVSEALRDYGIDAGRPIGDGLAAGVSRRLRGMRRPVLLSLRNAFRRRFRLALTVLALAMGGAVFLGALDLRAGIRGSVGTEFDAYRYHMTLAFATPYPVAAIGAAAGAVPGVRDVEAWRTVSASVVYPDGTQGNAVPVTGMPVGTDRVDFPRIAGRWLQEGDERALVVNDLFAEAEPRVRISDDIVLSIAGRTSTWTVVGIVRSTFSSPTVYASRAAVAAAAGETASASGTERANRAVVTTASSDPAVHDEVLKRLESALEAAGVQVRSGETVRNARTVLEDHMLMAAGFLVAMAVLIIVVGGLALAATMNIAVMERTREIGVMRAIGARHGTIRRIIVVEGLVVGGLSCLLAVPLSIPVTLIVGHGFGEIMLNAPVPFAIAPAGLAIWPLLVLVISSLASLRPAVKATRRSTAEALAYA